MQCAVVLIKRGLRACCSRLYRRAFRADMKSYPIQYEEQRHRTGIKRSHPSNNVPKRPRGFGTYTKSQSTLLNIYFCLNSRSYSSTSAAIPEYLLTLRRKVTETYPICDNPFVRQTRRSLAPLRYLHRSHRSHVTTEALPGIREELM